MGQDEGAVARGDVTGDLEEPVREAGPESWWEWDQAGQSKAAFNADSKEAPISRDAPSQEQEIHIKSTLTGHSAGKPVLWASG